MLSHLLVVPSTACPAACHYCFGPRQDGPPMTVETVRSLAECAGKLGGDNLDITFHGGEPLTVGAAWFDGALETLRGGLAPRHVRFGIQSNLWLLDDRFCELFRANRVGLGTSLDGPEEINDRQRGAGHFRRTMRGIELARAHGLRPSCICTFTPDSAARADEIFEFFLGQRLDFTIHAALKPLGGDETAWALSEDAYASVLIGILDRYLAVPDRIRIGTLDTMCRSVSSRHAGICTFGECLGRYLAVGPDGSIYPCQRFTGMGEWRLGNVLEQPGLDELADTSAWKRLAARSARVRDTCAGCTHNDICRGGCAYNALAAGNGDPGDPHCGVFRRVFDHIVDRACAEVFSEHNLSAVVEQADETKGLLREGHLLALLRGGPHPAEVAAGARRLLAAAALGASGSLEQARRKLSVAGVTAEPPLLRTPSALKNLYLHLTFACMRACEHCYASASPRREGEMSPAAVFQACRDAAAHQFRAAVITGGEPLVHQDRDTLLDGLAAVRSETKSLRIVLRTSLCLPIQSSLRQRIAAAADEVIVSVDGDRAAHDARRGLGAYDLTVANLRELVKVARVSLAAMMPGCDSRGTAGEAVRRLARELGISRVRFRSVLPLGRAAAMRALEPEPVSDFSAEDPAAMAAFTPVVTCGMGQNLYVEPDGGAYPCYAWHGPDVRLGTLGPSGGLTETVESAAFRALADLTVDRNTRCCRCELRYLCGGLCRAWGDTDCAHLRARCGRMIEVALDRVGVPPEKWAGAGLPLGREVARVAGS